jgi:hypothetical protein
VELREWREVTDWWRIASLCDERLPVDLRSGSAIDRLRPVERYTRNVELHFDGNNHGLKSSCEAYHGEVRAFLSKGGKVVATFGTALSDNTVYMLQKRLDELNDPRLPRRLFAFLTNVERFFCL